MSNTLVKSEWMRLNLPSIRKQRDKKVLGKGINDADYVVDPGKASGQRPCPAYQAWQRMLLRCYSQAFVLKNPTYKGVTVSDEWLTFSVFRKWWLSHVVDGWEIDKDLLKPGNKIYSADNCIFVPKWLNCFLNGHEASRGVLPIGVCFHKRERKYRAQIALGQGRQKQLGSFSLAEDAYEAWLNAKLDYAKSRKSEMDTIDCRIYPNVVRMIKAKR